MNIVQSRYVFGEDFTLSRLLVDGEVVPECPYILEDKVREVVGLPIAAWKVGGETAIPVGTYKVVIDMSQRFKKLMMHLLNVPGFDGIRVHAGNTSHDTEGCLIIGRFADEREGMVWGSRDARDVLFNMVFKALGDDEEVWWTVEGLPEGGRNHVG
jgi:hypothetical protein